MVQRLVHGGHLAQLHQMFDDLGGLDRHLVGQLGHGDGFRHVNFEHTHFNRCLLAVAIVTVAFVAAATTGACAPVVAAHTTAAVTAGGDGFLLGRISSPAGRQLGGFDFLVATGRSRGCSLSGGGTRARCRRASRFVQSAFDSGFGLNLGLFFLGDQHLFRGVHHGADGFGLGQSLAATRIQIGSARSVLVSFRLGVSRGLQGQGFTGFLLRFGFGYSRLRSFCGLGSGHIFRRNGGRSGRGGLHLRGRIDAGRLCAGQFLTLIAAQ